jgi:hypothetical protein
VQFYVDFTFETWSALMKRIIEQKLAPIYLREHEDRSKALQEMACPLIMRPVDMLGLTHIDWRYDEGEAICSRTDSADFARG